MFHEAVSSFLLEWARDRHLVPQTVHIVGEAWSGRAYELREVFKRCAVPHGFCLADSDKGRELLAEGGAGREAAGDGASGRPVLSDPSNAQIAEAAGAPAGSRGATFDVVIVGSGPAGLSAAVYCASEGLRILVVDEGGIGGQARSSSLIRNYLGFAKGVSGSRLAEQAYEQAMVVRRELPVHASRDGLDRSGARFHVSLSDGRRVSARAVILATGATYRRLGVASLEQLARRGRVLRRPGLGGAGAERQGGLHRRRRKLRRPGGAAPRALRTTA